AVRHVVARQLEAGIDVGNDGEQPRVGFSTYPARRMRGFGGASTRRMARDIAEHPDYASRLSRQRAGAARINDAPQAVAEVAYTDLGEATAECELFRRAPGADKFAEAFMTAASPGVIATIMLDAYYGSHERYVKALAREMRKEYELIVTRGFVLQLDCPDLAMERARFFQDEPLDGFLRAVALHVDAINEATARACSPAWTVASAPSRARSSSRRAWCGRSCAPSARAPISPPGDSGSQEGTHGKADSHHEQGSGGGEGSRDRREHRQEPRRAPGPV